MSAPVRARNVLIATRRMIASMSFERVLPEDCTKQEMLDVLDQQREGIAGAGHVEFCPDCHGMGAKRGFLIAEDRRSTSYIGVHCARCNGTGVVDPRTKGL